jgi:hypothetical protein
MRWSHASVLITMLGFCLFGDARAEETRRREPRAQSEAPGSKKSTAREVARSGSCIVRVVADADQERAAVIDMPNLNFFPLHCYLVDLRAGSGPWHLRQWPEKATFEVRGRERVVGGGRLEERSTVELGPFRFRDSGPSTKRYKSDFCGTFVGREVTIEYNGKRMGVVSANQTLDVDGFTVGTGGCYSRNSDHRCGELEKCFVFYSGAAGGQ